MGSAFAVDPLFQHPAQQSTWPDRSAPQLPSSQAATAGDWVPTATPYTLNTINGTLEQGVHSPPEPGELWGGTFDAATGEVWFGDYEGSAVYAVNDSTANETRAVQIPISASQQNLSGAVSTPDALAYDPVHEVLAVTASLASSVTFLNATTGRIEHVVQLLAPLAVAFDPSNHLFYVGGGDQNVTAIDGGNGSIVAKIPVPGWTNEGITYDSLAHRILGISQSSNRYGEYPGFAYSINDGTQRVDQNFTSRSVAYPTSILFDSRNGEVYILDTGNSYTTNVSVFNGSTLGSITTLTLPGSPATLGFNPISDEIYASCTGPGLGIIDGSNDSVQVRGIRALGGGCLTSVIYDPANQVVFAADASLGSVERINASNDLPIGESSLLGPNYLQAVYDPDNGRVYAAAYTGRYTGIAVIKPSSHPSVAGMIETGGSPSGVAYDSPDHRLFVTNYWNNSVCVIDTATGLVMNRSVAVGSQPYGIAYDPINDEVYVADSGSNVVSVLNATTLLAVRSPVRVGSNPYGVAVDTATDMVFVTNLGSANVTVLNGSSDKVTVANISVGSNPQGVVYDPQNGRIYVANTGSNTLSAISTPSARVDATIPVGAGPSVLTLDPAAGLLFTGNANGNSVTVVNTTTDTRVGSDLLASQTPEGIAYVPGTQQVYVTNWNAGAINIIANAPTIGSVRLSPTPAEVGVPVTITTAEKNGTSPYSFAYSGLPRGCVSLNAAILSCLPAEQGEFNSSVTVTDAAGYVWTTTFGWSIFPRLGVGTFVAGPDPVDVGTTSDLNVVVAGGVADTESTYAYEGLPTGCGSYNSSRFACTPTQTGTFAILVTVTDPAGGTAFGILSLEVVPGPYVIALYASPGAVVVNATTELVFLGGGGIAPFNYEWTGLPPGCVSSNVAALACAPNQTGSYTVEGAATDGLGLSVRAFVPLDVSAPAASRQPNLTAESFFADPSSLVLGGTTYLVGTVTGGVPPYALTYPRLPQGCTASTEAPLPCRPSEPGSYSIGLVVEDSAGVVVTANTTLLVVDAPATVAPPEGHSVPTVWWVAAVGAAFGIGAFAVLLAGRGRRHGRP